MKMDWRHTIDQVDWDELCALYHAAPLGNKDAAGLRTAYANSMFVCFVYDDDKLVGAGRAVADGVDVAYLGDVALLPSHQGMGLGTQIVNKLLDMARGHKKIILYSVPGKEGFYKKFGFKRMSTAMAIFEDQDAALKRGHINDG